MKNKLLLEVRNLKVDYAGNGQSSETHPLVQLRALEDLSFSLLKGEILGVVGESGCGKSTLALALMRLLPSRTIIQGEVFFKGRDLLRLSEIELQGIRGKEIGIIWQDPGVCLNPFLKIATQFKEVLGSGSLSSKAVELLSEVGLTEAENLLNLYPHQLSMGMKQRVLLALALANHPQLVIADEPTSALDPPLRTQVINFLKNWQKQLGSALIIISHDFQVVSQMAPRLLVIYAGVVVEEGGTKVVFKNPLHPYTKGVINSIISSCKTRQQLETLKEGFRAAWGCSFHPRCDLKVKICEEERPLLREVKGGRLVACHRASQS